MAATRGIPGSGPARDYLVVCHRCPGRTMDELRAGVPDPAEHRRSVSVLIGSPQYGALWHCLEHADCPTCPRGPWTDRCTCPDCSALPMVERQLPGHGLRAALAAEERGGEAVEP